MYKDSAVYIARKRSTTPTSDDDSYFLEDNDRGGKIPENKKRKASQPIAKNKKKKKENKKKQGVQLSLIGARTEFFDKAPLLCLKMTLFMDEYTRRRFPNNTRARYFCS